MTLERSAEEGDLLPEMQAIKARCKEHFYPLLNQQGIALSTAGDDICGAISMTEIMRALLATASRKSPGLDGIPSDILKKGGSQLRETLLLLHNRCLQSGQVLQDFRYALVVSIRWRGTEPSAEATVGYQYWPSQGKSSPKQSPIQTAKNL